MSRELTTDEWMSLWEFWIGMSREYLLDCFNPKSFFHVANENRDMCATKCFLAHFPKEKK